MRLNLKLIVLAPSLLAASLSWSATVVDFSKGTPAGASTSGNSLIVGDYRFTGSLGPASVGLISTRLAFGDGLLAPSASGVGNITVSRVDGHVFDLNELDAFVSGTLVTGPADFEVVPFDAAGAEGNPVVLSAGQFATPIQVNASTVSALSNITSFKLTPSLVDHFTGFVFTSAYDSVVSTVPEPSSSSLGMLGASLWMALALWRKRCR